MQISERLHIRATIPRSAIISLRVAHGPTASCQPPRLFWRLAKVLAFTSLLLTNLRAPTQEPSSPVAAPVPNRYLVLYRDNAMPRGVQAFARTSGIGAHILNRFEPFGIALLRTENTATAAAAIDALRSDPSVEYIVHDRILSAHRLTLRPVLPATLGVTVGTPPKSAPPTPVPPPAALDDNYYTATPQSWAVVQSGGYGAGVAGGPTHGPWDTTLGAGVRIAILDSGVDQHHPDIAPNVGVNLSEIDQSPVTGLPSPCDDASPQDQQGHGTWTASLAAGAMGAGTGLVIGVAPAATILNIKVLERLPDPASTAADSAGQCATGQAGGLLSWVIQGIEDAIAQHASVINLSLGTLVDLENGEGAGLKATFDRVTYAATQSGAVVIASAGNDGLNLANPRYIELPAQARGVVAIVSSTNPACAEDLTKGTSPACRPGAITLPYYSNYGAPLHAIAAPGGSYPSGPDTGVSGWILGACSSGLANTLDGLPADGAHSFGCFNLGHTPYVQAMGTSASAALAAGAAALVRAANPGWTPEQVVAAMRASSTPSSSLSTAPLLNLAALIP